MRVVMPMAGRASRFKEAGYTLPKPLIEIRGKPMVRWATDSIPFVRPEQMIFIVLQEHIDEHQIDARLREMYTDAITIIPTDGITEGAACTVLLAKHLIDNDEELIIYNTDQYFRAPVESAITHREAGVSGLIPVFHSNHPRWSFARTDRRGYVLETAEKVPISSHATVGLYYFSRGRDFVRGAEGMIRKNIRRNNEFYVCPVYNELIGAGQTAKIIETEFMWSMGTPEDVAQFIQFYSGEP